MKIAGLQKTTLIDYPGEVAATLFTQGCNFRCPFCHNPELVLPEKFEGYLFSEDIFDFLLSRLGKLNGVCITGGEPLLQPDITSLISHIKALGFKVKLDTNGTNPIKLEEIIKEGDINYIAMDIKAPIEKYHTISGTAKSKNLQNNIIKSIELIKNSGINYEFRTTVVKPYHTVDDFKKIGELLSGAKLYYLQNFVHSKHVKEDEKFEPFSASELKQALKIMQKFIPESSIR